MKCVQQFPHCMAQWLQRNKLATRWHKQLKREFNPLNTELNLTCKSQLAELFCGVFKFCAWYSKNLNISRTKRDKFVKSNAICGEGIGHCSECLKNAVMSLLHNGEHTFLKKL